jgi:hypothetical protein
VLLVPADGSRTEGTETDGVEDVDGTETDGVEEGTDGTEGVDGTWTWLVTEFVS